MRGAGEAGEEERTPIEWELMQGRHGDLPDIKLQVQRIVFPQASLSRLSQHATSERS